MHLNPSYRRRGGEEAGKTRSWVNYGQVANSIFFRMRIVIGFLFNGFLVASEHLGHFRQANRWSQVSPSGTAPTGRDGHTSVWCDVADGMYVFGGSPGRGLSVNGPRDGGTGRGTSRLLSRIRRTQ